MSDDGVIARIRLSDGSVTTIDSEDLYKVEGRSWSGMKNHAGEKRASKIYAYTAVKKKMVMMHRVITNAPEGKQVDHINGDSLDNRKVNLRVVSQSQNMHNAKMPKNKYGMPGVRKNNTGKFYSSIKVEGVEKYLGLFATAKDASRAYMREKSKLIPA